MRHDLMKNFKAGDDFLGRFGQLVRDAVIPYQEQVFYNRIEGAEKSHAMENFAAAARAVESGRSDGAFYGLLFQDSDVAKWFEAAAYSLLAQPDPALEKRCDDAIDLVGRAQQTDGYLNTYFTVKEPDKRWTNLQEAHELYCAGHMIEAAVAYAQCTGKTKLLEIMSRMADHIYNRFITDGAEGYPGHPEIELALMRLYRFTNNEKYKALAEHFVNVRGVDADYYLHERERHPWTVWGSNPRDREYMQCHLPVRQQTKAVGHAVRAAYLYAGMADIAAENNDEGLKAACKTLWGNITRHRMYVTGGIGSAYEGERFTCDDHLPNDTAYSETCASIALIFFARNMLDLEKDGEYADVMERALYNCVLAGMQLDGKRFFYVNPLEAVPGLSGEAATHRHALPERPRWFNCACCPPNVARLVTSIAKYAWSLEGDTLYAHLFTGGTLDLTDTLGGRIAAETGYPYEGRVTYRFEPKATSMRMTLAIRLPGWSQNTMIKLNGMEAACRREKGYACITGEFAAGDVITVDLDMEARRIYAATSVSADSGRVAFSRGPLVYCAEGIDNNGDILSLYADKNAITEAIASDKLGGITVLQTGGYRQAGSAELYSYARPPLVPCKITLIPYYAWSNRGLNQMRVWLPEV